MTHLKLKHKISVKAKQEGLTISVGPLQILKIDSFLKQCDSIQELLSSRDYPNALER